MSVRRSIIDLSGIKVLIVNDQPVTRIGLRQIVSSNGALVEEATCSAEATSLLKDFKPQLLLTEIRFFSNLSFDFLEASQVKFRRHKTLVFSAQPEFIFAERVIRSGAQGFICATAEATEIENAIARIMSGEIYLSHEVERQIVQRIAGNKQTDTASDPCASLSNRELDILHRLGNGLAPREIANELTLSVKTIESYRDRLKEKLGMNSSFQLLRFALECQIFGLDTKPRQQPRSAAS